MSELRDDSDRGMSLREHRQSMQPLSPDAVEALEFLRDCHGEADDRVFPGGVPSMKEFKEDLDVAGIPYVDTRGEYADFHALRKTFGTMLTVSGVGERTVIELMRHSDMRLTAKTYTDANMLPISDAMASLMRYAAARHDTQIDALKSVEGSQIESASVLAEKKTVALLTTEDQTFSPAESASVNVSADWDGSAGCRVRTCDLSPRRLLRKLKEINAAANVLRPPIASVQSFQSGLNNFRPYILRSPTMMIE
jgi:hypothetical protein